MLKNGHSLGLHGHEHFYLSLLVDADQISDINKSIEIFVPISRDVDMIVINQVYYKVNDTWKSNPEEREWKGEFPKKGHCEKKKGKESHKDTVNVLPVGKDFFVGFFHKKFIENLS